ncbi:hypothetical protein, variant 2 [Aphanomyces astaci]|uniref:Uncharacterized protein n=1 Tax=Aphanomyces astaci TaxID=112090 RepID=W4GSQ6_APHAT|nr:hypothetical protein, variant 3 [Aphanomyces astaci]XP_009827421.1 hypothetical protein, variant 2 [Aphanomyces astaci]ETV82749.1 hypothetical protein, variant 2 [Aphanomyces astaci]ETV82750.1 hypothetical protein, variant 3 [Aphanomyces astaci]|eukprot:XP_009827419.1 hypothetical protein, variant 3 [Aphanomyces astaci]
MNDRAARNAGAPGSGGVPQRGNFSHILSKLRDVPVKIVAADTNAELLHDVLASLRQKALDLQNDKWMYKELSFL